MRGLEEVPYKIPVVISGLHTVFLSPCYRFPFVKLASNDAAMVISNEAAAPKCR